MKADVPPVKPPRLDIPSWVPDAIAHYVGTRYAADVDRAYRTALEESGYFEPDVPDGDTLDHLLRDDVFRASIADLVHDDELADITRRYLPLTCDHRMKSVWRELSKKQNGGFLYPAISMDRDAALLELFKTALECRRGYDATTTQRLAEIEREGYLTKAEQLRDDAVEMLLRFPSDQRHERCRCLHAAAQAYEDLASEIYATESTLALERRHDGRGRFVALTIGGKFRALFGKPSYGMTAKIVSVVLGREFESRTVQHWLQTAV